MHHTQTCSYEYELYHHGIKGQRWGIRRFQKKDGSLTSAGKKRYYDTPGLSKQRDEMEAAKTRRKESGEVFDKASNRYSYMPTQKNRKALEDARTTYQTDAAAYQKAKLKYSTNKEVARINTKDVTFDNKSNHRLRLEEQFKKMGMSDEQAQAAANNRIRTEKVLAGSAAMTVAACAAYVARKHIKDRTDGLIKSGDLLQRVEMADTGGKLHDMFYTSTGERDNRRYERLLGMARKNATGHAYLMKLQARDDIKVASKDRAGKVFGELYKTDPEFRESVKDHVSRHFAGRNRVADINNLSDRNIRKMYENFNVNLMYIRNEHSGADKKFYEKLKSMGYGAIQDINDMKYSGYNAKNPLIVFNNSSNNIMVKSVSELKGDLNKKGTVELLKATGETMSKDFIKKAGPLSAAGLTAASVTTYRSDPNEKYKQGGKSKWD